MYIDVDYVVYTQLRFSFLSFSYHLSRTCSDITHAEFVYEVTIMYLSEKKELSV